MFKPLQAFKRITAYQLTREIDFSDVEQCLVTCKFTPCLASQQDSFGFVSPFGDDSDLMSVRHPGFIVLVVKREVRKVPVDAIKQSLAEKIRKLETKQSRHLKKFERDALKDEVHHSLQPRAFSKFTQSYVLIDLSEQRLYVSEGSSKAEDCMALLRKALGSLPIVPLTAATPIEISLTNWVKNQDLPAKFKLGTEAKLRSVLDEGGAVTVKKLDLSSDEVLTHVDAGKRVIDLTLSYDDRLFFNIDNNLSISKTKFSDALLDQNGDISSEEEHARMDADCILLHAEMQQFMADLIEALGGIASH